MLIEEDKVWFGRYPVGWAGSRPSSLSFYSSNSVTDCKNYFLTDPELSFKNIILTQIIHDRGEIGNWGLGHVFIMRGGEMLPLPGLLLQGTATSQ